MSIMTKNITRHMLKPVLLLILLLPAISLSNETTPDERSHEYTLKNGLKLIVHEDHRAPIVVSQIWYRVGSSDEHNGISGVSHVLEHMMFKGTHKIKPGEFSRIISRNGGRENAFTGRDYTAYFQQLEKSRLPISFKLEADRMRNLLLDEEEFARELQVVIEERRLRTEDNPEALTYEQLNATAFTSSPYQRPIIGWMNDLENLTVADLQQWYKRWYAPNNATLVISGDVIGADVYKLAKKYFGRIKPSELQASKPRIEAERQNTRRITVRAPAKLPYIIMGYKVPTLATAKNKQDAYALEVLAGILDGGNSARLQTELVRGSQIAASASAGYSLISRYQDLLLIDGTPNQAHSIEDLQAAILKTIDQLKNQPITKQELKRVKAQVIAANVYEQDSVFYQAMHSGMLETVGLGWRTKQQYVDNIKSVTATQVQAVAKRYLNENNLTIAELDPQPLPESANHTSTHGANHGH